MPLFCVAPSLVCCFSQFFDRMTVQVKTSKTKPTLMERLDEGKRKTAQQDKPTNKAKKREL